MAIKAQAAPVPLSPQQLVDCDVNDGGCSGGFFTGAYSYMAGGMCTTAAYPYSSGTTGVAGACRAAACTKVATAASYVRVTSNSRAATEAALARQPLSVGITASASTFQFYSSGVYTDTGCAAAAGNSINHAVLLTGMGSSDGMSYYTIKNSWGTSFGESGFMRIARGDAYGAQGLCMIQAYPYYPVAA